VKIMHLIDSLGHGGAEHFVAHLVKASIDMYEEIIVVSICSDRSLIDKFESLGIRVVVLNHDGRIYSIRSLVRAGFRVRNILIERKIDVLHSHLFFSDFLSLVFAPRGFLRFSTVHGIDPSWLKTTRIRTIVKRGIERLFRNPKHVKSIAVSDAVYNDLIERNIACRSSLIKIYNGIDISQFPEQKHPISTLDNDFPVRLIQVGRFYKEKGQDLSVHACRALLTAGYKVVLILVGDGPERNNLKKLVNRLELTESVIFSGISENIPGALSKADIFLMPSRSEGLGLACIEAMCAAMPIVASKVGGLAELIAHEKSGLLVSPNSIDELVNSVKRYINNRSEAVRFGECARATALKSYSINNTAMNYFNSYRLQIGDVGDSPKVLD
jgi:glycosyltransferase involved in cell wall biosynthesis